MCMCVCVSMHICVLVEVRRECGIPPELDISGYELHDIGAGN